jgi:hypothetical protein
MVVSIVAALSCVATRLDAATVRTVALYGDTAPGTAAGYFDFSAPIVNSDNLVAFVGQVDDGSFTSGLWSEGFGSLAKVALEGEAAPSTLLNFGDFADTNVRFYLNQSGQTAFEQRLSDFSTAGIFSQTGPANALRKVAAGGDSAPGANDPTRVFQPFLGTVGGFNDSGQSAFQGGMPPTAMSPFASTGVWSEGSGTLDKVAEIGDPAPGNTGVFSSDFRIPAISNDGHVAFAGQANGSPGGQGVWTDRTGSLVRLAGNGDAAPGGGTFSTLFNDTVGINANDDIVFSAKLVGGTVPDGIWVARGGGIDKVAVEGDLAPSGGGATFSTGATGIDSGALGLSAAGETAFTATLSDARRGLFSEGLGGLHAVALSGDTAPDSGGLTYLNVIHWTMNDLGQTAFLAQLSDFSRAIFAEDALGVVHGIVAEGELLEVAPGDFREVITLGFQGLSGSFAGHATNVGSGFSYDGSIGFQANLFDELNGDTSGVFVTIIPEPSSAVLLAVGAALMLLLRRRRR